jgi:hypothetical protein
MSITHTIVRRAGRFAIVRVMPSGDAAGYDVVADRNREQRHYQLHRDRVHVSAIDAAFSDSRKYSNLDDAIAAADGFGLDFEIG